MVHWASVISALLDISETWTNAVGTSALKTAKTLSAKFFKSTLQHLQPLPSQYPQHQGPNYALTPFGRLFESHVLHQIQHIVPSFVMARDSWWTLGSVGGNAIPHYFPETLACHNSKWRRIQNGTDCVHGKRRIRPIQWLVQALPSTRPHSPPPCGNVGIRLITTVTLKDCLERYLE